MNSVELRLVASEIAFKAVQRTMNVAEKSGRHTPGSWTREGDLHHLKHVIDHVTNVAKNSPELDISEEYEHAITRLVMAYWSYKNDVFGDNGDEGVDAVQ